MKRLTLIILTLALLLPIAIWAQCGSCNMKGSEAGCPTTTDATFAAATTTGAVQLAGYNKVNMLNDNYYFTYNFPKKPKLGNSILAVKVFGNNKKLSNDYEVFATADMPSMKGMHATGDIKLKANKKGELLVPLNFVMPGTWQVDLKFVKAGKTVYVGYFTLKI